MYPRDIDKVMLGLDREDGGVDTAKDQLSSMRWKFADLKARYDSVEVRAQLA